MAKLPARGYRRFLLVRDGFYDDLEAVYRVARGMEFFQPEGLSGFRTTEVYYPRDTRRRLEKILGMPITEWSLDPTTDNGVFYYAFAEETPCVHFDRPTDQVTVVLYLTPGLPADCGTSLWRHKRTGVEDAPTAADARRAGMPLARLRQTLERDCANRSRWIELDRAGYRPNRIVAYASGMLHSATRHFGRDLADGRIYQTFRIGVDWSRSRIHA